MVGGRARKRTGKIWSILECSFSAESIAPYVQKNVTVLLPVFQRTVKVPVPHAVRKS